MGKKVKNSSLSIVGTSHTCRLEDMQVSRVSSRTRCVLSSLFGMTIKLKYHSKHEYHTKATKYIKTVFILKHTVKVVVLNNTTKGGDFFSEID